MSAHLFGREAQQHGVERRCLPDERLRWQRAVGAVGVDHLWWSCRRRLRCRGSSRIAARGRGCRLARRVGEQRPRPARPTRPRSTRSIRSWRVGSRTRYTSNTTANSVTKSRPTRARVRGDGLRGLRRQELFRFAGVLSCSAAARSSQELPTEDRQDVDEDESDGGTTATLTKRRASARQARSPRSVSASGHATAPPLRASDARRSFLRLLRGVGPDRRAGDDDAGVDDHVAAVDLTGNRSRPRGAGPSRFSPTRVVLRTVARALEPLRRRHHGTRQPRCTHRWHSATMPSPCRRRPACTRRPSPPRAVARGYGRR